MAESDLGDGQVTSASGRSGGAGEAAHARRRRVRRPAGPPASPPPDPVVWTEALDDDGNGGTDISDDRVSPEDAVHDGVSELSWWQRPVATRIAAGVAVLVIGALVAAGVLLYNGASRIEQRNDQRAEYSAFARQMIVSLTTINPSTVDKVMNTFATKTSGTVTQQLRSSFQQTTDLVRSDGVSTRGVILSDAVTDSDSDSATVILVAGWSMTERDKSQPDRYQTLRWKVQLTRINGELKLTDLEWVT